MSHVAMFALALGLAVAPARSQSRGAQQPAIDAAIDRGVAHLLELYSDGEGRDVAPAARGAPTAPGPTLVDRPGLRALTVYALLKCGVARDNPVVERLVAHLAFERFDRTCDAACMLLALVALDPIEHGAWIGELASDLLSWREKTGDWGYPGGDGDLSNTQFAALALRAAASTGVEVPVDVWADLARAVLRYQARDGGFAHVAGDRRTTGSMTAAGVGTLAICEMQLAQAGALHNEIEKIGKPKGTGDLGERLTRARADGLRWLARNFLAERDLGHIAWTHYYLYGLERLGALAGVERIGDHDWYQEGARFLVATQDQAGDWPGTFERVPALFALLFLRRATALRGPETETFGERRPRASSTGVSDAVHIEAYDSRSLRVWIASFSKPDVAALEWPGERGDGPRVLRVEYFADGKPIAAALGDPDHPAGDQRFRCEYRGLARGPHRLAARVFVRVPPVEKAGAEHNPAPAAFAERVLTSNEIEVEVRDELPVSSSPAGAEHRPNRMANAQAKATASSVISGAPAWSANGYGPRAAIDGNPRSPWIATAEDKEPALRITLENRQRANRIRITPARLIPRSPHFLTLPREIAVRINGGEARTLGAPGGPRDGFELRLETAVVVQTLELRLVARDVAGKAVGIGEVELRLASE